MGYIKEPKGINFTMINREMTEEERKRLSEYIAKRKIEIKKTQKRKKILKRRNETI